MNHTTPRRQFIEGLDRYVSDIETDDDLERLATNVSNYHDRIPSDAAGLVSAIVWPVRRFHEQLRWSVGVSVAAFARGRRTGRDRRQERVSAQCHSWLETSSC